MVIASAAMITASLLRWWPLPITEVLGFATGGVCVWLTVREHIANFPIGLANNIVFFVLFWQSRLFADMWLQAVYFGLGVYGWWAWLHGGANHQQLHISRTRPWEWWAVVGFIVIGTGAMREALIVFNGAAPFWDALTTGLSLAAQFLLCRKRLEHWFIWMLADCIYVPLYLSRKLPLTAVLYAVFLVMCIVGLREWVARWRSVQP